MPFSRSSSVNTLRPLVNRHPGVLLRHINVLQEVERHPYPIEMSVLLCPHVKQIVVDLQMSLDSIQLLTIHRISTDQTLTMGRAALTESP